MMPRDTTAQSIGGWTFNNLLTGTPGLYNTISTADFSAGIPTRAFNGGTEYYGQNGWPSGALNTAKYLQFSLTPSAGYQLDISTLVLRIRRSNTGSPAGSGPTSWALRSSLDGFTTDIASGTMTHAYANYTVTPGTGFLNLYSTVVFRLYGYTASTGSGGNSRFVVDNITVNGLGYLLPVRLGTLQATMQQDQVRLSYMVYNSQKNSRYFIERSVDGAHFTPIQTLEETTEASEKQYNYTDPIQSLTGVPKLYYRVQLTGNDGTTLYSARVAVNRKPDPLAVKGFISNGRLHITGTFVWSETCQADLYTMAGQAGDHFNFTAATGYNSFDFMLKKGPGTGYIVHLWGDRGYSHSFMVLVR